MCSLSAPLRLAMFVHACIYVYLRLCVRERETEGGRECARVCAGTRLFKFICMCFGKEGSTPTPFSLLPWLWLGRDCSDNSTEKKKGGKKPPSARLFFLFCYGNEIFHLTSSSVLKYLFAQNRAV